MKKKQVRKQEYIKPDSRIIRVMQENLLLDASGQHKDAENGGSYGNAKQTFFDDEEDELNEDY